MSAEFDLVAVGGGPRVVQALVALDDELASSGWRAVPMTICVVDPCAPGAGAVWRTDQPAHLVMNLDPSAVDFSSAHGLVEHDYRRWEHSRGLTPHEYPPRALMGEYLTWVFGRVQSSPRLRVVHVRGSVDVVERSGRGWVVGVVGANPCVLRAPEVLLCTGHRGGAGVDHAAIVAGRLGGDRGAPVTVRGAALTGLDVVLGLTQGRGSRWENSPDSPSGLRWIPSGREPRSITLLSRSGELMTPKPEAPDSAVDGAVRSVTARWQPGSVPDAAWWDVLLDAAAAAARAHGITLDREMAHSALDAGRGVPLGWEERWCADLCRAAGITDEEPAWWLGRAWSAGYAHMVASLERAPRPLEEWYVWRSRSARLERWAFGPPVGTVRRMLSLGEAGVLSLARGTPTHGGEWVDAVTAGPGVLAHPGGAAGDPLWRALHAQGVVHVRQGERGVWTRPDGRCLDADGVPVDGLNALGRPTEDPVIGHDTLTRVLHGDTARWAARTANTWAADHRRGAEEIS